MQETRCIEEIVVRDSRFREVQTGDAKFRELVKSIKGLGVLRPLGITQDNRLVYGARQLAAAKEASARRCRWW